MNSDVGREYKPFGSFHVKSAKVLGLNISDFNNFQFVVSTYRVCEKSKFLDFLAQCFFYYGFLKDAKNAKFHSRDIIEKFHIFVTSNDKCSYINTLIVYVCQISQWDANGFCNTRLARLIFLRYFNGQCKYRRAKKGQEETPGECPTSLCCGQ